jgi:hypothetical protein
MAKSKLPALKDLSGYFFMAIQGENIEIIMHDNTPRNAAIGAALATVMQDDDKFFDLMSAALLTVIERKEKDSNWERVKFSQKEKSISKKSNIVPKKTASKPKK